MKVSKNLLAVTLLTFASYQLAVADPKPAASQRTFFSSNEAIKALQTAAENNDMSGLKTIFGPEFKNLLTGDKVQDANHEKKFAAAMAEGVKPVNEGDNKIILEIGTNNWPMPIPLVNAGGKWFFDTVEGKEEVMNRHIGKDELHAIGLCRAYVAAQKQYSAANGGSYATNFKSLVMDSASPFSELSKEAHQEGYSTGKSTGLHMFHGYCFKILPSGTTSSNIGLVAYPASWDKSGIMTFIVNQDGKVYARNFGAKTQNAAKMIAASYTPDDNWKLEEDEGVSLTPAAK